MRPVRYLMVVVLALPLAGCLASQQKKLAACDVAAATAFPKPVPGQPFKAVKQCMDDAGYEFIGWNDGVVCDLRSVIRGIPAISGGDAMCFQPKNWLWRKLYRIEVPDTSQTSAS